MRQVFTSPRLENVEAVAKMLRDAGIEVKITEARSYRGNRRSSFSCAAGFSTISAMMSETSISPSSSAR